MSDNLNGKVVLLCGASGDIGQAAARMLLERGASVGLHYRTSADELQKIVDEYGGDRAVLLKGDLTRKGEVSTIVSTLVERFGKLDAFITTIGTKLRIRPFLDTPEESVDITIAIELRSVIDSVRAVLPELINNGGGRIVIIGSDSGKVGTSGESVSAACRGGAIAFIKSIAREYARHKVLANVVCPGPTDTGLWEDLVNNDEFGGKIGNAMIRAIPLRRLGKAEEVAGTAVFLVSEHASYITGQAISVSGGLTMS
ncbi:NAD(P)-dependent dehydrogenase (short-subunit alcohol dehydrogenase family) [Rhizobium sp. PP-F2F-G48]|uniref:SDR family NAD(P)-dependent oxidoreductase n=1 Tax=Rhizobium sp. PP-F2F-G48 TaxID=2135651 RepID=UPI00104529D3|nr:SDR family NAD(P)-dependent oxidoreductase [Rhizobium sp. PP-F2F-G48]TCM47202.1 NAD(P)-dependent dehydrogenase (short-subunit alcohol dehydrogenase family) [Rhizobium sp. PP-F2F-G48]